MGREREKKKETFLLNYPNVCEITMKCNIELRKTVKNARDKKDRFLRISLLSVEFDTSTHITRCDADALRCIVHTQNVYGQIDGWTLVDAFKACLNLNHTFSPILLMVMNIFFI